MRQSEELREGAEARGAERGQADKVETEGEKRKQRLIVIDGGKQRERVKRNKVSGTNTGDGETMAAHTHRHRGMEHGWGLCVL